MDIREKKRLRALQKQERRAAALGYGVVAGVDEAGRGPLAGPIVAAACHIPPGRLIAGVNDSKKLSPEQRERLFEILKADADVQCTVGIVDVVTIDQINIYQATLRAMLAAVAQLRRPPDYILVDGLKLPHPHIPTERIVGGDASCFAIAAASIIAKVTRDRLMRVLHQRYPVYGFNQHKGYGTPQHLEALQKYGPCPEHRRTFEPIKTVNNSRPKAEAFD